MFSEVTEVRDGVHYIAERCVSKEVCDKLAAEMKWYDHYLEEGNVDRSANPTPGNKKGGLCNIVEKAMGSIAKSGSSPIVEVLSPAERPSKKGLIYAATPASDIVCGPCQLASGITLQVFMTGRGTPYGLAAAPVIKVCSRNEMKEMWQDLIDINAVRLLQVKHRSQISVQNYLIKLLRLQAEKIRALQKNINSTMICASLIRHRLPKICF